MNRLIEAWAKGKDNVKLICYDKYIHDDSDFFDTINHFVKRVYYDLAGDLVSLFDASQETSVRLKGKKSLYKARLEQAFRAGKGKLAKLLKR